MQPRSHRRVVLWLAVVGLGLGCALRGVGAPAVASSGVKLEPIRGTPLMLIPVYLNGQGPFPFILDTGADDTVVDGGLAKRLGLPLPRKNAIAMRTVGGNWSARQTMVEELQAGPAKASAFAVLEGDLSTVRSTLPGVKGILGQDFLLRFNYLLSYKDQSIVFERGNEIRDAIEAEPVRLESPRYRMVLEAQTANAEGLKLRLMLDSGANTLVLSRNSAAAAHVVVTGTDVETTANAKLWMRSGKIDQLMVASRSFHNLPVTVTTLPHMEEICDGLLPTAFFRAIYVNNREGFVEFVEDASGGHAGR